MGSFDSCSGDYPLGHRRLIATSLVVSLVTFLIGKKIMRVAHLRETLALIAIGIGMALLGWIAARIDLFLFDPLFLRGGSFDNFKRRE